MTDSVDLSCINFAQWLVRQIELFSAITRKHMILILSAILALIGFILTFAMVAAIALIITRTATEFNTLSLVLPIGVLAFGISILITAHSGAQAAFRKEIHGVFPIEVITNKYQRILSLLFFVCNLVTLSLLTFNENRIDFDISNLVYFLYVILGSVTFQISLEYILCTTSLPPGEKERRKLKK